MVKVINLAGGGNTDDNFNVIAIEKNLYEDIKKGKYYVNRSGGGIDFSYFQDCLYDSIDDDIEDSIYDFVVEFKGNVIDDCEDIAAIPVEVVDAVSRRFGIKRDVIEELFDEVMSKTFDNDFEGTSSVSELEIKFDGEINTYSIVNVTTLW